VLEQRPKLTPARVRPGLQILTRLGYVVFKTLDAIEDGFFLRVGRIRDFVAQRYSGWDDRAREGHSKNVRKLASRALVDLIVSWSHTSFDRKVVGIQLLDRESVFRDNADVMLDHQFGKLSAVDQYDCCLNRSGKSASLSAE